MPVFETFSKRQKRLKQESPTIYQYDTLPSELRVQVVRIIHRSLGVYAIQDRLGMSYSVSPAKQWWDYIQQTMCDELGVFTLTNQYDDPAAQCSNFILQAHTEDVLDIVELAFRVIDRIVREKQAQFVRDAGVSQDAESAIRELNRRFQEHAVGYKYEAGELFRVDSEYLHSEAVEPALRLLHDEG